MVKKVSFSEQKLSRRERQIMDAVYTLGKASIADIIENIPNPPSPGALRRMVNILEQKQLLKSRQDGLRKIYSPAVDRGEAQVSAMNRVVNTFFGGSAAKAMASLFENSSPDLSNNELEVLSELIDKAKEEGR